MMEKTAGGEEPAWLVRRVTLLLLLLLLKWLEPTPSSAGGEWSMSNRNASSCGKEGICNNSWGKWGAESCW